MHTIRKYALALGVLAIALSAPSALAAPASQSTAGVHLFSDGSVVSGARSKLVRTENGVSMNLHTSGLTPGHAVTVWWVVFNHPENCTHGSGGFSCGEGDLFEPSVEASVLHAAGNVIGNSGKGNFGGHLSVGDAGDAILGSGLSNPLGADVHFVVRDHGPKIPGLVNEQIHTFNGGCNPGEENEGLCVDLQFSIHE